MDSMKNKNTILPIYINQKKLLAKNNLELQKEI